MNLFFVGAVDGKLNLLYKEVLHLEQQKGIRCDWVIAVGGLGIWPDPAKLDRATRLHSSHGDFAELYVKGEFLPRPTLFIAGTHEDHKWLNARIPTQNLQILPNLHWLAQGYQTNIGCRITGLGRVYSKNTFQGIKSKKSYKHYTREELNRACSGGPTDFLILNQGPKGEQFGTIKSEAEGIKNIIFATKPKYVIHSGYNFYKNYACLGAKCLSLENNQIVHIEYPYCS